MKRNYVYFLNVNSCTVLDIKCTLSAVEKEAKNIKRNWKKLGYWRCPKIRIEKWYNDGSKDFTTRLV